jgi:hypothetical protein
MATRQDNSVEMGRNRPTTTHHHHGREQLQEEINYFRPYETNIWFTKHTRRREQQDW